MAGCHLGQMHVGGQANLLHFSRLFRGDFIIQIFSHRVWIDDAPGPEVGGVVNRRRRVTCLMRSTNSRADSLSATFCPIKLRLGRLERIIQISQ